MSFRVALVLGGSLIYAFAPGNGNAGALMIAAGCALQVVMWFDAKLRGHNAGEKEIKTP